MERLMRTCPFIAIKILEYLDQQSLLNARLVSKLFCNFITNEKFIWKLLTEGHPGWEKLLKEASSEIVSKLGKTFLGLKNKSIACHPIFCVVRQQNFPIYSILKTIYPDPYNGVKFNGFLPFHFAALFGCLEFLKYYLNKFEHHQVLCHGGVTALHCATATGQLEATKLIVQNLKVNKYPKDQKGRTPLHYAALNGYINVVKFLINTIENERPEDQIGPGNAEERCRQLKRSQKNPSDNYHATALHYAAGAGHLDIVQVLVQVEEQDHPQDVNGCTPLHWACLYGQVDVVRYLFKHEDKFFKCRFERTALHYAACGGNIPTFEFVFDKYPWFQAMDRDGKTALHHAAAFGNIHVVAFLLEKIEENFYEVNIKDSNGETPMHYAAKRGHFNVVFALTNSVIEKNPKDTKDKTPLHLAAEFGYLNIVRYLIQIIQDYAYVTTGRPSLMAQVLWNINDGNVNPPDCDKMTPLHYAARGGYFGICQLILNNIGEGEKNPKGLLGFTPLHIAAQYGHIELVDLFMGQVQEKNPVSDNGLTPFQVALLIGDIVMIRHFEDIYGYEREPE